MTEKIMTQHPEGKKGVNIDKGKYDTIRSTILDVMDERGEVTFTEMSEAVAQKLNGNFDGSVGWYTVSVKLDLEARGILERIPKTSPHRVRVVQR